MKIEVNISKKYAFAIIGLLVVLIVGGFVYAYTSSPGAVPNPGHALTSIQGYFQNDADLQVSLGKFCQADGTNCQASGGGTGTLVQVTKSGSVTGGGGQVCCDAGYVRTGCSAQAGYSYPQTLANNCCFTPNGGATSIYVHCAKVQ